MRQLRILKNKMLLKLGFTLQNRHGHTVHLDEFGLQVRSNKTRKKDYSLDDKSWKIKRG